MDGFVSGESNVNDVVALIEHEVHGRGLIQHAPVDAYLGSFWLGLDVDRAHVSRAVSTALEKLLEFANRFDVVYVAKHPECGSEMECLTAFRSGIYGQLSGNQGHFGRHWGWGLASFIARSHHRLRLWDGWFSLHLGDDSRRGNGMSRYRTGLRLSCRRRRSRTDGCRGAFIIRVLRMQVVSDS